MHVRENGDGYQISGIGWDDFCYDYDVKTGDTIHFRYNSLHFVMYLSAIHTNGESKRPIPDIYDEGERPVAYSNHHNLTNMQVQNMHDILDRWEDYPARVHCLTGANIHDHNMVLQRPIVGRLGLQQYGTIWLEMSRPTVQSIQSDYHIRRDGRLEINRGAWSLFLRLRELLDVGAWVVILVVPCDDRHVLTIRFRILSYYKHAISSDNSDDDLDDEEDDEDEEWEHLFVYFD